MPKAKKRKAPITNNVIVDPSSSKPQTSRTLIRRFHVLLKKKAQLEHQLSNGDASKRPTHGSLTEVKLAVTEVENEIEELGGLEAYQRMSSIGQGNDRGGGSEKYLILWLKEMKVHETCQRVKQRHLWVFRVSRAIFYTELSSIDYLRLVHSSPTIIVLVLRGSMPLLWI